MIRRSVHSLWTGTPAFAVERGPLLITTLSVCLAARAFEETWFITDARGAEIAGALGWEFEVIDQGLRTLDLTGLEHIWALGKIAALLLGTSDGEPALHIDNDAMWLEPPKPEMLAGRLIAQGPEHPYGPEFDAYFEAARLPRFAPFNCGIIGGSDNGLVRDYASFAMDLAWRLRGLPLDGGLASMTIEQAGLAAFAAQTGTPVTTLLRHIAGPADYHLRDYCHLSGPLKRDPYFIARAEFRLRRDFPAAFDRFQGGFSALATPLQPPFTAAPLHP